MRVSTPQYFNTTIGGINTQQSQLLEIQEQMSSGRRINSPSDDPVAAGRTIGLESARRASEQFIRNQGDLESQLEYVDGYISSVLDTLQTFRARAVQAGNGALSDADRQSLQADFVSLRAQVFALANSQTETGAFIFSGSRSDVEPFAQAGSPPVVSYAGDTLVREIQISANRQIPSSFSGSYLFVDVPAVGGGTQDVFQTMQNLVEAMDPSNAATRTTTLQTELGNLDQALDRLLEARASIGTRLTELDAAGFRDAEIRDQYVGEVSRLVDLDYVDAAGRLASRQLSLQAAQQSYARVSQLSLFQYL